MTPQFWSQELFVILNVNYLAYDARLQECQQVVSRQIKDDLPSILKSRTGGKRDNKKIFSLISTTIWIVSRIKSKIVQERWYSLINMDDTISIDFKHSAGRPLSHHLDYSVVFWVKKLHWHLKHLVNVFLCLIRPPEVDIAGTKLDKKTLTRHFKCQCNVLTQKTTE